jgi:hypothetical protein
LEPGGEGWADHRPGRLLGTSVRILLITIGGLVAMLVLGAVAIDEGEVIALTTFDADGKDHLTQLWIVDLEGDSYLRSTAPDSAWLERLRARPEAVLARGEEDRAVTATPVSSRELLARVNRAMAEKYGTSDRLYSVLFDRSRSVPVRIEPRAAGGATLSHRGSE